MKTYSEIPDLTLTDPKNRDKLQFTIRYKTILISCIIDDTGNEWEIPIKTMLDMLTRYKNEK